jgi:hypothetical protein
MDNDLLGDLVKVKRPARSLVLSQDMASLDSVPKLNETRIDFDVFTGLRRMARADKTKARISRPWHHSLG